MSMVVLSDPEVAGIPVEECGEELVDVRKVDALRVDPRLADPQGAYARLRAGVVDRLVTAQSLLPPEYRLLVVEGYRPLALQTQYFHEHLARLRVRLPDEDETVLYRMASTYISPPEVAPHVAGAAVDITLCGVDGAELWLGTQINDTDTAACHTASPQISRAARANRDLLGKALAAAGLVNYPSEWWHWSYGDRYWAYHTGAPVACYQAINWGPD
jgi:D-alanyl-D-alanine dipeptidase